MDRNHEYCAVGVLLNVALRKESVDRNLAQVVADLPQIMSLSARRAWIEITRVALK